MPPRTDTEHIARLEQASRRLEPSASEWRDLTTKVLGHAEQFRASLAHAPGYEGSYGDGAALLQSAITEQGMPIGDVLALLRDEVDTLGVNSASSRYLGYIPGGGLVYSAFGDFLAALSNRYAGIFFSSPGAVRMEDMLTRWTASVVGYPPESAGFLASGGSIANLSAIVTAREAHGVRGADIERSVVYVTTHLHHCVDKALRIAGLGQCPRRMVAMDEGYRMSPRALEKAIRTDKAAGLLPWMVAASAGTTNTGAVDPLEALGEIASAFGLWFHIDGAYGAFFALCPEGRAVLRGIASSDSLVLDPHKSLFLPFGTGALLVKDRRQLLAAHGGKAEYMEDSTEEGAEISSAFLSPELTKHFRGLRMWLPLKVLGVAPFRAALSEKIQLARYFYERVAQIDGFEVGPYPDLSVVTYRYAPARGDADLFNKRLVKRIHADGRVFLTHTRISGKVVLRLAVGSFRTHRDDVDLALTILRQKAEELAQT